MSTKNQFPLSTKKHFKDKYPDYQLSAPTEKDVERAVAQGILRLDDPIPNLPNYDKDEKPCKTCEVVKKLRAFPTNLQSADNKSNNCFRCSYDKKIKEREKAKAKKEAKLKENK